MSDKITVQQRKYFVERIENSINEKINELRQGNAAQVQNISEREYEKYLEGLNIKEEVTRYKELWIELEPLASKIRAIFNELEEVLSKDHGYSSSTPSLCSYKPFSGEDLEKAMRWCCHQTAKKHESETDAGKMITNLQAKKRAAIDELHGINELDGLKIKVNNILQGADVPLLGQ